MSIAVNADARVKTVTVTDDLITFHLVDERVISVPLLWSWRLSDATPAQRNNYEIIGDGQGVGVIEGCGHAPLTADREAVGQTYSTMGTR